MRPNKYTRLTNEIKLDLIDWQQNGYNISQISEMTGIARKTVADFLNGNTHILWWLNYYKQQDDTPKEIPESSIPKGVYTDRSQLTPAARDLMQFVTPHNGEAGVKHDTGLKIIVIPDTQVKPESDISHIIAAGNYIYAHKPDVIVVIGDWWDMSSLNNYGSNLELTGRRIIDDIEAGKNAMVQFLDAFYTDNYQPRLVFTVGNHDPQVRIPRFVSEHPKLEGFVVDDTTQWLEGLGFEVYEYLDIVNINGVRFSHYFQNPHSAKKAPLSGQIDTMIKNAGFSFVQGHTQVYKHGKHYLGDGTKRIGLVCGAFYSDVEDYMGVQGNNHWRGICLLNEVKDGGADICEISMAYLLREWL